MKLAGTVATSLLVLGCATARPAESGFQDPCAGKTPDACAEFVRAVHQASAPQERRVNEELVRACMGGNLDACQSLSVNANPGYAKRQRLCELGQLDGCLDLWPTWVRLNCNGQHDCREKLLAACKGGHPELCLEGGAAFRRLRPSYALELEQVACDQGVSDACLEAARQLAAAGPAHDDAAATNLFIRGCEQGSLEACDGASDRLHQGLGIQADPARAQALDDRACLAGSNTACGRSVVARCVAGEGSACAQVQSLGSANRPKGAEEALQAACEKRVWPACAALAAAGRPEVAQRIACAESSPVYCLGVAEQSPKLLPEVEKRVTELCGGEDLLAAWACTVLSERRDAPSQANAERACRLGNMGACSDLSERREAAQAGAGANLSALEKQSCAALARACVPPWHDTDGHACDRGDAAGCFEEVKTYYCGYRFGYEAGR